MTDLNVYLLEMTGDDLDYGIADSAVVVAEDPEDARHLMCDNVKSDSRWLDACRTTVTVIAENPIGERGVILAHETPL